MKDVTIIRNENVNGKKVYVGEKVFSLPENVAEAVQVYGEKEVYDNWYANKVIALRATIGTKETMKGKVDSLVTEALRRKEAGDSSLYDALKANHIIS